MVEQQFTHYVPVTYTADYFRKKAPLFNRALNTFLDFLRYFLVTQFLFAYEYKNIKVCLLLFLFACLFLQQIMRSGFNCVFLDTPLIIASLLDDSAELLKVLVQYGAYLDFRSEAGYTALHNVAMIGRIETLEVGVVCFEISQSQMIEKLLFMFLRKIIKIQPLEFEFQVLLSKSLPVMALSDMWF